MPDCRNAALLLAVSATALAAAPLVRVHQAGPEPGHTGGFGEPTCHTCHFDYPLNDQPPAGIRLDFLPATYQAGQTYRLLLSVQHPELKRGGFQLSARFEDGTAAGSFVIPDTTLLRIQRAKGIAYVSHTATSAADLTGDAITWTLHWTAPAPAALKRVLFHVAVNVANADVSEFGDRVFTAVFYSDPPAFREK